jgi:hypothetical protein
MKSSPSTTASPRTARGTSAFCRFGLRNSHDKSFPIGVAFGSRVFVCDNLAFIADHVVKRRHTTNLKRDLPALVTEMIEPLALHREAQAKTFERYKGALLTDQQADHAIMGSTEKA